MLTLLVAVAYLSVAVAYPSLIPVIIGLIVAVLCWYLIDTMLPENPIKVVLRVVVVLVVILWLLRAFGIA